MTPKQRDGLVTAWRSEQEATQTERLKSVLGAEIVGVEVTVEHLEAKPWLSPMHRLILRLKDGRRLVIVTALTEAFGAELLIDVKRGG